MTRKVVTIVENQIIFEKPSKNLQSLAAVEENEESSDSEVSVFKVEHVGAVHNKKDNILDSWTS